jgi:hypothetical protein
MNACIRSCSTLSRTKRSASAASHFVASGQLHNTHASLSTAYSSLALLLTFSGCFLCVCVCQLSTGIYGFDNEAACHVALRTTREWLESDPSHAASMDAIVFVVFLDKDLQLYQRLLPVYFPRDETEETASAEFLHSLRASAGTTRGRAKKIARAASRATRSEGAIANTASSEASAPAAAAASASAAASSVAASSVATSPTPRVAASNAKPKRASAVKSKAAASSPAARASPAAAAAESTELDAEELANRLSAVLLDSCA